VVAEVVRAMNQDFHFTVGSLPSTRDRADGFFNFQHELELLKAALLYADRVKLCSVGASFMSSLNDLDNAPFKDKLTMMREFLPMTNPGATPEELEKGYRLIDALGGSRTQRRALNQRVKREGRKVVDEGWKGLENIVQEQFRTVRGAEEFRGALRSGLVELHPFRRISAVGIIRMGMEASGGLSISDLYSDEIYDEYEDRIYATVQDGTTYPLFDDKTGNIVGEAVRRGLILPSQGAFARGRHGGLSGDLLQRLPLFERASVAEVLNIREELADHLDAFREAVSQFADAIGPASWDEEFTEEAERIVRERVAPAVRRIERAVEERRDLRELSWRFGPPMAAGVVPSVGVFVGSGSVLGSLAALAVGVTTGAAQGAARHREHRRALEGNQLYFYYSAGELLRGAGR
jgi:hypothetical protein